MAMGVAFGYYAYFEPVRMWRTYNQAVESGADTWTLVETWVDRILQQPNIRSVREPDLFGHGERRADCRAVVPVHGIHRRARQHRRPSVHDHQHRHPAHSGFDGGGRAHTCALFATATGIVGAVVTLMGLLAYPAMLKARYDTSFASGVICAGGHARHPHPAVDHADRLRRHIECFHR
jgi:hypothetical protein